MNDAQRKDMIETAVEIVFTYPEWTCEHVNAYMKSFPHEAPYDISELYDMCQEADEQKQMGNDYHTTIKNLLS